MPELNRPPERGHIDQRTILARLVDDYRADGYMTRSEAAKVLDCSPSTVPGRIGAPDRVLQRNGQRVYMYVRERVVGDGS